MISPSQYVKNKVCLYSLSYASTSEEQAKLKVFNQLLNVIGNGIRDEEELAQELKEIKVDTEKYPRLISGEKLFFGYKDKTFSETTPYIFEEEKALYPDIEEWYENTIHPFSPYPNFDKNYSIIYNSESLLKSEEWIKEIIWFYQQCRICVENNNHYYAFPKETEKETKKHVESIKNAIESKNLSSNEEISTLWGAEFSGDYYQFCVNRWNKEKERIFEFIDVTIEMLEDKLR